MWGVERLVRFARWATLLVAGGFVLLWIWLVVSHLDDRYAVGFVSGTQLALIQGFREGSFYPEIFDGTVVGGTRLFPLQILPYAGLAEVVGDPYVAGKITDFVAIAVLSAVIGFVVRKYARLGWVSALLLGLALPASQLGLWASTTIRFDPIGSLLGIGAILTYASARQASSERIGAVLGAVAVFARPTTVWAPLALMHEARRRGRVPRVVLAGGIAGLVLFGAILVATQSRFLDVIRLTVIGDVPLRGYLGSPYRMVRFLTEMAVPALMLIPLVVLGWNDPAARVYRNALAYSALVVLFALTNPGITYNHLLDPVVLVLILSGFGIRKLQTSFDGQGALAVWSLFMAVFAIGIFNVGQALGDDGEYPLDPVAGLVAPDSDVLFEDAGLAVGRDQIVYVLDAWMLPNIPGDTGNEARDALSASVADQRWDNIVLREPIDQSGECCRFHASFWEAMARSYCLEGVTSNSPNDDFYVYSPCEPNES